MTLFEISQELQEKLLSIGEQLANDKEVSQDEIITALNLQDDFQDKAINVGKWQQGLEKESEVLANEISKLNAKKKRLDKQAKYYKELLLSEMKKHNLEKIGDEVISLSVRKAPKSIVVADVNKLPSEYQKVKIEPNKTLIKNNLDSLNLDELGISVKQNEYINIKVG